MGHNDFVYADNVSAERLLDAKWVLWFEEYLLHQTENEFRSHRFAREDG